MTNVLIRDVPDEDLEQIRSAAAAAGASLQGFLLGVMHAQAVYLRRQVAISRTSERLRARPAVPDDERQAVLDAVDRAHEERADQLGGRTPR